MVNYRIKKNRVKRWKAPAPIPPPKPPRPSRGKLKNIYKDLVSSNRDQRLEALKKAMHWYEKLQAYLAYNAELTVYQIQAKSDAERARLIGLNANKSEKKEDAYIKAIQFYEKLGRKYHVPKIGTYLSKYSHERSKLVKRKNRFSSKFREFLELVVSILKPVNYEGTRIQLRVDKIKSDYIIDSEGNITFDRKFLDAARRLTRSNGLLPGLMNMFPVFTEAASMTMETDADGHRTGRYTIHNSRRHKALLDMLHNLTQYSLTNKAPKKLVRRHIPSAELTAAA